MTDTLDVHKAKALELAVSAGAPGAPHAQVVERAKAFHEFLTGKPDTSGAATTKVTAPAAKPGAQGAAKPATAPKATPATGAKTPAPAKAGAATPKAGADAPPPGDTKDAKGNNTFDDVKAALLKVMRSVPGDNDKHDKGRKLAYDVLATHGGGVKAVRDLKPALYDTVVAACEQATKPKAKGAPATPPKAAAPAVVEDDLGQPVDTSGADAATAGADDPPEGGSGEDA